MPTVLPFPQEKLKQQLDAFTEQLTIDEGLTAVGVLGPTAIALAVMQNPRDFINWHLLSLHSHFS